jgi:hypothetical protein
MRNSVGKALPPALAVLLAMGGAVFAGDNAGALFSITPDEFVSVGPGDSLEVVITGDGLQGLKSYSITLEVLPATAFNLEATTFETSDPAWISLLLTSNGTVEAGAGTFGDRFSGDGFEFGTFTLKTADGFVAGTAAEISLTQISVGPSGSLTERDVFDADALMKTIEINKVEVLQLGDANGDGFVSLRDAIRILRFVAGEDVEIVEAAADVNGIAGISAGDALRVMRFISGLAEFEHP